MACSSLVVCLIFWTALQFETQPVILAALENASNGVVHPVKSIQEFISSYSRNNDLMPCSEEIIPKMKLEAWREQHVKLNRHTS
ncbi:unnamed protein product [Bemisia tabaci]|uniref:Uncharacterized protein n=1 Tax=Bemisia tabaci TaxID=7038 RepID=A0AAI8UUE6_BEMTA|nr:unnamed protein product [Bemisia tabaci]